MLNQNTSEEKYLSFAPEINEIFRAAARAIRSIKPKTEPIEILLPCDGKNCTYRLQKLDVNIEEPELARRTLEATLNAISQDRFDRGYSPFKQPFVFKVEDKGNHYLVHSVDTRERVQGRHERYDDVGYHIGLFQPDQQNKKQVNPFYQRFFVESGRRQFLENGAKFQMLVDRVWVNVTLVWDGSLYAWTLPELRSFAMDISDWWARI